MLRVFTDGGARGNPGPAALGVYICNDSGKQIAAFGKTLGVATNNVAEYQAVIAAYDWLLFHTDIVSLYPKIHFYLDSELVVSQLNGVYKIKNATLQKLHALLKEKERALEKAITYTHIPRSQNKQADRLVNNVLDNEAKVA